MQICATATTVAFQGLEARRIEVQVQMTGGTPAIVVVGLGDKAVSEARERVRAAFASIGLAIPPGRLIVNLAPADMPKEGTPVTAADLALQPPPEGTAEAAARVMRARDAQSSRGVGLNAVLDQASLEKIATPDAPGAALLAKASESLALSARAYHRTLKVAHHCRSRRLGSGTPHPRGRSAELETSVGRRRPARIC